MKQFSPVSLPDESSPFAPGFPNDKPIDEVILFYKGIDIKKYKLTEALELMARRFVYEYVRLQPTYAQFTSHHLRIKFQYLIERVIQYYGEKNIEKMQLKFWDFATQFYPEAKEKRLR